MCSAQINAADRKPTSATAQDGLIVKVWGITFKGGRQMFGGGARVNNHARFECYQCHFLENTAAWFSMPSSAWGSGGAISVSTDPSEVANHGMSAVVCDGCIIERNTAIMFGGGIYVDSSDVRVTRTIIRNNLAYGRTSEQTDASVAGQNMIASSGRLMYILPATPGHWVPNGDCRVVREGCESWESTCPQAASLCAYTPDTVSSSGQQSPPTVTAPAGSNWYTYTCKPAAFMQPCDWKSDNSLLGLQMYARL